MALGFTIGAVSFVSAAALPLVEGMLQEGGLKTFFLVMGGSYFILFLPLLFLLVPGRRRQQEQQVGPGSEALPDPKNSPASAIIVLGVAGLLIALVGGGSAGHLAGLAKDTGAASPAMVGSIFALGVMIARPVTGLIIDHMNAALVAAVAFALAAAGLLIAALGNGQLVLLSALLLATAVGADLDVVAYLASRHVSRAQFGRVFGWLYCGILLAAAAGPVLIALLRDLFDGYQVPFLCAAALAAVLMLRMPPYETRQHAA